MRNFIESLECRTLFSIATITQDFLALKSAAAKANVDSKAAQAAFEADAKAVKATVAASHPTKSQKQALATVQKQLTAAEAQFKKEAAKIVAPATSDAYRLVGALKVLEAHRTAAALAKVTADFAALQSVFSTQAVTADESAVIAIITGADGDLNTFAAAVPAAQSGVTTAESQLATAQSTFENDISAIQSDVTTIGNDLP